MLPLNTRIYAHSHGGGGINGTSTQPSPLPMALSQMIVIYAIVSSELLLKHLSCRSFLDLG